MQVQGTCIRQLLSVLNMVSSMQGLELAAELLCVVVSTLCFPPNAQASPESGHDASTPLPVRKKPYALRAMRSRCRRWAKLVLLPLMGVVVVFPGPGVPGAFGSGASSPFVLFSSTYCRVNTELCSRVEFAEAAIFCRGISLLYLNAESVSALSVVTWSTSVTARTNGKWAMILRCSGRPLTRSSVGKEIINNVGNYRGTYTKHSYARCVDQHIRGHPARPAAPLPPLSGNF